MFWAEGTGDFRREMGIYTVECTASRRRGGVGLHLVGTEGIGLLCAGVAQVLTRFWS